MPDKCIKMSPGNPFLSTNLLQGIQHQFKTSSSLCDVILCDHSESPKTRYIPCHSFVLGALSPFLQNTLTGCQKGPIYISLPKEVSSIALRNFIKELYDKLCSKNGEIEVSRCLRDSLGIRPSLLSPKFSHKVRAKSILRTGLSTSVDSSGFIPRLGRFICPFHCGELFKSTHALRLHLATHESPSSFMCEACGLKKDSQSSLRLHQINHHRPYSCSLCSKTFFGRSAMTQHTQEVHRPRLKCPVCLKDFGARRYLIRHLERVHGPSKEEVCPHCAKGYKFKHKCRVKMRKTHDCHVCGAGFILYSQLHGHLRRCHSKGGYPLECPHCPSTFSASSLKHRHIKSVHTHRRLFNCRLCGFVSLNRRVLLDHKSFRHGIGARRKRGSPCGHCGLSFQSEWLRRMHIQRAHE